MDDGAMSCESMTGQVALVTGASRGIGRILTVGLAQRGAAVAGIARPSPDLDSLTDEAGGAGVIALCADVTSPEQVQRAFEAVRERLGSPTLVVTCAGTAGVVGRSSPVVESGRGRPARNDDHRGFGDQVDAARGHGPNRDRLRQPGRP